MKYSPLIDRHGRRINYVRLAVTDRCNLRCFYCMPEEGIQFLEKKSILTYEEMLRLLHVFKGIGVDKIRITGGEPFVRKDLIYFLKEVKKEIQPQEFAITTNATLTHLYMDDLPELFQTVNVSLDSLDAERFFKITRRDDFKKVFENIQELIRSGIQVKINAVVMNEKNIEDIISFVEWTRNENIEVRFIEEMPFNGTREKDKISDWNYVKILQHIQSKFKNITKIETPVSSTSMMYQVNGFTGKFGIIPAFSRTFCGTCNRIRITAKGELLTCLYSSSGTNLLQELRQNKSEEELEKIIRNAVLEKEKNGFEAAKKRNGFIPIYESMTTIGG